MLALFRPAGSGHDLPSECRGDGEAVDRSAWPAPPYTSSVDAVLALIEKKLPGWGWSVHRDDDYHLGPLFYWASVTKLEMAPITYRTRAPTPALALLLALLTALEANHV